jgi:hypothetical protein
VRVVEAVAVDITRVAVAVGDGARRAGVVVFVRGKAGVALGGGDGSGVPDAVGAGVRVAVGGSAAVPVAVPGLCPIPSDAVGDAEAALAGTRAVGTGRDAVDDSEPKPRQTRHISTPSSTNPSSTAARLLPRLFLGRIGRAIGM